MNKFHHVYGVGLENKEGYLLYWSHETKGFGQFAFYWNKDIQNVVYDVEMMSVDFGLEVLEEWFKRGRPVLPMDFHDE